MVSQKDVLNALRELNGKATIKEIAGMLYLKKQISAEYSIPIGSSISRILTALRGWGEVDRIMHWQTTHPKTTTQDIWFIKK